MKSAIIEDDTIPRGAWRIVPNAILDQGVVNRVLIYEGLNRQGSRRYGWACGCGAGLGSWGR
jgi:hypothetical protein